MKAGRLHALVAGLLFFDIQPSLPTEPRIVTVSEIMRRRRSKPAETIPLFERRNSIIRDYYPSGYKAVAAQHRPNKRFCAIKYDQ